MDLSLDDIGPFVEQNVVSFDDGRQLVQDGVCGQVDLVQEYPVTILKTLDQRAFDELEDEATTRFELLGPLLQVVYLQLQLSDLRIFFYLSFQTLQAMVEAFEELLDLVVLVALLGQIQELLVLLSVEMLLE